MTLASRACENALGAPGRFAVAPPARNIFTASSMLSTARPKWLTPAGRRCVRLLDLDEGVLAHLHVGRHELALWRYLAEGFTESQLLRVERERKSGDVSRHRDADMVHADLAARFCGLPHSRTASPTRMHFA